MTEIPLHRDKRRRFFSEERERLLSCFPVRPRRPADALHRLLHIQGFRVEYRPIDGKDAARTYPDDKKVIVCNQLSRKLRHRKALVGFHSFTLAHELAHVLYHRELIQQGAMGIQEEKEADDFAAVFLVPARALVGMKEAQRLKSGLLQTSEEIWAATISMARKMGVSGACMKNQLRELGYIEFDRSLRRMKRAR